MKSLALNIAKFDNSLLKLVVAASRSAVQLADYGTPANVPIFEQRDDYKSLVLAAARKAVKQIDHLDLKVFTARSGLSSQRIKKSEVYICRHMGGAGIIDSVTGANDALRKLPGDVTGLFDGIVKDFDAILSWAESVEGNEMVQKTIRVDLWQEALNHLHEAVNRLTAFTDISNVAERIVNAAIRQLKPKEKSCPREAVIKIRIIHHVAALSLTTLSFLPHDSKELGDILREYTNGAGTGEYTQKIEQQLRSAEGQISAAAEACDEFVDEHWYYME